MPATAPLATAPLATPADVLGFWFDELAPKQWFKKDPTLDRTLTERFGETLIAAARGECQAWRTGAEGRRCDAEGRLAEILVLDQFSRNIHRDTPSAFAQDPQALTLAKALVECDGDRQLPTQQRVFAYMPFMHSERLADHDRAVELFDQPGMEEQLRYEYRHREILERFGRYPHRNAILGRESTPAEVEFLRQPGSSF
ncbi:DUF924 family protein [Salinicola aestuarinus]|uniref:DUF924 family protein n=1 Tax=Salinicola aestuarinus TaxID=1949082 RepID=UPI000DA21A27|nr:DUF924 family protein [Salinicola aestuarinus]